MKKGLKFWSKLLIVSFFLGGMATSAIAQNGATTAFVDCAESPMLTFTRTANQMATGTNIPITFTGLSDNDEIYFVAKGMDGDNGGQGHLREVNMDCGSIVIGDNLQLGSGTPDALNNVTGFTANANASVANGGIRKADFTGSVIVRATDIADPGNYTGGDYYLGVFVKSSATQCYSDVYYIKIDILQNIYASLVLNNGKPYEYICHDTKTTTNIGFTMCNLPGNGTLTYTVNAVAGTNITGHRVYASGNTAGDMDANLTAWNATISGIVPVANHQQPVTGTVFEDGYTVQIGQQTLLNANVAVAEQVVFSFSNMTYTYKVDNNGDGDTDDSGETIQLPVVMESAAGYCHVGNYDTAFTVYVAPNFGITTKLYANEERTSEQTRPFCQGTMAYLGTTTTATEGDITDWVWVVDAGSANATEARAKFSPAFSTTDPIQAAITSATGLTEITAFVGLLTDSTENVYNYDLTATWNDAGRNYTGCTAKTDINIAVQAAPILLVATDQAEVDGVLTWNATDKITADKVCPGNPIALGVNNSVDIDLAVANRTDYMEDGNFVRDNKNAISWTVSPYSDPAGDVAAYTAWRSTPAPQTGNLSTGGDTPTLTSVAHFLNNSTDANANVIYTIESTGECALVKSNGMPLTNGKVQVIYPVDPRPTFGLAN